jgi:hypothetical protein
MSTTTLSKSSAFTYIVSLRSLERPVGAFSFEIKSTWAAAKDPAAERQIFQVTLDRERLLSLRSLIDQEVAE